VCDAPSALQCRRPAVEAEVVSRDRSQGCAELLTFLDVGELERTAFGKLVSLTFGTGGQARG
jgi:hypothetical protein